MTGARFLAVKNFEEYQHYHDRTPPWIKLYNSLLDDYTFLRLSEPSQIHLVKLWLLASRHDNRIPNDLAYISGKLLPKSAIDIEELIVAGFIYQTDDVARKRNKRKARKSRSDKGMRRKQDASNVLAARKQDARPEGEVETEGERETERDTKNPPSAGARKVAASKTRKPPRFPFFPTDVCDDLYDTWKRIGNPSYGTFRSAFARLYTKDGAQFSVDQLRRAIIACVEDVAAGDRPEFITPNWFVSRVQFWVDRTTPIAQRDPVRARALGIIA